MRIYRQKLYSSIDPDVVLQFLGRLSGFIHKAKSLHWAAKGKDIHEYLDGFWKELYEFQDTVAEGWMGIAGKISDASEVPCIPADSNNPMSLVREVESRTLDFYDLLPAEDPRFKGLTGETESFIQTVEKYKYLFSLCFEESSEEKEFSDKDEKLKKAEKATALTAEIAGLSALGSQVDEIISNRKFRKALKKEGKNPYGYLAEANASKKIAKLGLKNAKNEYEISKLANGLGKIDKKALELAKDKYKVAKEDVAKHIKEVNKSKAGKLLRKSNRTNILLLTGIGAAAASSAINKYRKKNSGKPKEKEGKS